MRQDGRSKEIKRFSKLAVGMDDVCANIYIIMIGKKKLFVNELFRALERLGIRVSKSTFLIHLGHLEKQKLIRRKPEGVQNVAIILNEDNPIEKNHAETVKRWLDSLENWQTRGWKRTVDGLPPPTRSKPFDAKEFYDKMSEQALEREIERDIQEALLGNLYELKAIVGYDLELDSKDFKKESDADFWKFIGNPLYRLFEKSVAENCRISERYRKKFFEKIDSRIGKLEGEFYGSKLELKKLF